MIIECELCKTKNNIDLKPVKKIVCCGRCGAPLHIPSYVKDSYPKLRTEREVKLHLAKEIIGGAFRRVSSDRKAIAISVFAFFIGASFSFLYWQNLQGDLLMKGPPAGNDRSIEFNSTSTERSPELLGSSEGKDTGKMPPTSLGDAIAMLQGKQKEPSAVATEREKTTPEGAESPVPPAAGPNEKDDAKIDANEFSQFAAQCAAFYQIGAYCYGEKLDEKGKQRARESMQIMNYALYLGAKKAGLSEEGTLARSKLAMNMLMGKMSNNCVNIAILLDAYSDKCKTLLEQFEIK